MRAAVDTGATGASTSVTRAGRSGGGGCGLPLVAMLLAILVIALMLFARRGCSPATPASVPPRAAPAEAPHAGP
jgi:hypothetical protein